MKLNKENVKEALKNEEFINELNICIENEDKEKIESLFKKYNLEASEKECSEILETSKILLQKCTEEDLKEIVGGGEIKIKSKDIFEGSPIRTTMAGGLLTITGLIVMAIGVARGKCEGWTSRNVEHTRRAVHETHYHTHTNFNTNFNTDYNTYY